MLELIVLGLIPGTDWQITETWSLVGLLLLVLGVSFIEKMKQWRSGRKDRIRTSGIIGGNDTLTVQLQLFQ